MKFRTVYRTCIALSLCTTSSFAQDALTKKVVKLAEKQADLMLQEIPKAAQQQAASATTSATNAVFVSPRSLKPNGDLAVVASRDWTSGFFPGYLWFLYGFTNKEKWLTAAKTATAKIEQEKTNGTTHDMGFKVYCSFGTGYRFTQNPVYRDIIVQAARTLRTRFYPKVGTILSWDHSREKWAFPVIIDNMMNLELLFAATRITGDSSFYKIAVAHANTAIKNHFRPDYSSYHVVDYDSATGQVTKRTTHQGYANESAWARGQGWALYGYTMCYRETKNKAYLSQAEHIAQYILDHPNLPKDLIPYWDFNALNIPNEPRDVSAAAVIASALYELSTYSTNGTLYRSKAEKMVKNLAKSYTAKPGSSKGFLLLHSTGSKPSNSEVDAPLSYADYYYMEALMRRKNLQEGKLSF